MAAAVLGLIMTETKTLMNSLAYEFIKLLEYRQYKYVFAVPGATIDPLLSEVKQSKILKLIIATDESSAGFMADAYARLTEQPGICAFISNAGTMNAMAAISTAYQDKSPVLFISGSNISHFENNGAFQDPGIYGSKDFHIVSNITNNSLILNESANLSEHIKNITNSLNKLPKSPAYLQIPVDILKTKIKPLSTFTHNQCNKYSINTDFINKISEEYLRKNHKIILLIDHLSNADEVSPLLIDFAEKFHIPVASTLYGKGIFPENHDLYLGIFGYGGHKRAHQTLLDEQHKIILAVNVDFNQRNSLCWSNNFQKYAKIIQINQFIHNEYAKFPITDKTVSCLRSTFQYLSREHNYLYKTIKQRQQWLINIKQIPKFFIPTEISKTQLVRPSVAIQKLRQVCPNDTILSVDSGEHRIFAAHYWLAYKPKQYLTSINNAMMGWAIASGISAKLTFPDKPSIVITGDGCMLMNGNAIATAAKYNLAVIYIIINNNAMSKINHQYRMLNNYNWESYAKALGLEAFTINDENSLTNTYKKALQLNKPCLIDIKCCPNSIAPNETYITEEKYVI